MNPSRNMGKYRSLLANGQTPMIPFYPIVRKVRQLQILPKEFLFTDIYLACFRI